ncbi:endospore germination permease [Paludicola sp. MB14-C6]|uniref:GerAB/ArcD/ProY family transporter n=1 Tax=Paludihabitans sp. MB14-C6 TaxID=3070656 RepID=UPI0027DB8BF5|nr:endospore germination permease [Paludicola sp. MB14-C6]WMJ24041.1 endospore germination permease [Paludicola sp. MB14-C6]
MEKKYLTSRRAILLICVFIFGSTAILGFGSKVKQDTWISLLIAYALTIPLALLYARIMHLYPSKNIYDIMQILFGKVFGSILTILFVWYCLHLGALVVKNYSGFVVYWQMPESPELGIMLIMIPVLIYVAKKGVYSLSKWTTLVFLLACIVIAVTTVVSIKNMRFENLLPVLEHNFNELLKNAYKVYAFPFAETVVFLTLASYIPKKENPYKIYFSSLGIMALLLFIVSMRNLTVGGCEAVGLQPYPSYYVVKLININESLSRFESTVALTYVLSGVGKIVICLIGAAKGITKLVKIDDYKLLIVPCAVLIFALTSMLYRGTTQEINFINYYGYYAIPFQVVIPTLIWITAEVKTRKQRKATSSQKNNKMVNELS